MMSLVESGNSQKNDADDDEIILPSNGIRIGGSTIEELRLCDSELLSALSASNVPINRFPNPFFDKEALLETRKMLHPIESTSPPNPATILTSDSRSFATLKYLKPFSASISNKKIKCQLTTTACLFPSTSSFLSKKFLRNNSEKSHQITSVDKRNARERTRVHTVNQAFYLLKHLLPTLKFNAKRVSKLKILRAAVNHICSLMNSLHSGNTTAATTHSTTTNPSSSLSSLIDVVRQPQKNSKRESVQNHTDIIKRSNKRLKPLNKSFVSSANLLKFGKKVKEDEAAERSKEILLKNLLAPTLKASTMVGSAEQSSSSLTTLTTTTLDLSRSLSLRAAIASGSSAGYASDFSRYCCFGGNETGSQLLGPIVSTDPLSSLMFRTMDGRPLFSNAPAFQHYSAAASHSNSLLSLTCGGSLADVVYNNSGIETTLFNCSGYEEREADALSLSGYMLDGRAEATTIRRSSTAFYPNTTSYSGSLSSNFFNV